MTGSPVIRFYQYALECTLEVYIAHVTADLEAVTCIGFCYSGRARIGQRHSGTEVVCQVAQNGQVKTVWVTISRTLLSGLMLRVSAVRIGTPEDGNPSRNRAEKAMRICVSVSPPTSVDSYACEYQRRAARTIVHTNSVASEHRTQPRTSTRLVARDVAVHQHLV
jgi:hypothetical protein